MNTTTQETVVEVSVVVVAPARCDEGQRLIKAWSDSVKAETNRQKCLNLFFDHREYDAHRKECVACTEYELSRRAKYL